jgi:hypothetical protein
MAAWAVVPMLCIGLAGCGSADTTTQGAAATNNRLGAFPIANAPPTHMIEVRPGHFALLSMGETIEMVLPGGRVRLTGLGPSFPAHKVGTLPPASAMGSAEVDAVGEAGTVTLGARQFVGTDEQGQPVALRVTPFSVTLQSGQHATMRVAGTFTAGDGALSFVVAGHPLVTWDFSVELD